MLNMVVVGSGNVAEHLVMEIERAPELRLVQIFARNPEQGARLAEKAGAGWTDDPAKLAQADVYVISVSDAAVAPLSGSLDFPDGAVVAHTAGCVPLEDLSPRITHRAVLYPFQSFTKGRRIDDFRRVPFFIEGCTPHALAIVRRVAEALSDNVIETGSERRARIHMAGSFANNFTNLMFTIAEEIVAGAGAPFDYLRPIIAETVAKAMDMPSPVLAQTGPAQRGDRTIQDRHLAMLRAEHPQYVEIYKLLSKTIWEISKKTSRG